VRTGKAQIAYMNFPIASSHPNAPAAHEFAMCAAEQGQFWPAADALFRTMRSWGARRELRPFLDSLSRGLPLDQRRLAACLDTREMKVLVDADYARATQIGVGSTPSFLIGGRPMVGAQPYEAFQRAIDAALAEVVDADAIRHFASHADAARDVRGTVVFTPHPGEARALADALALDVDCTERATRPAAAMALAQRLGSVVVLKGAGTVTSDGLRAWRCDRGNAALATGGSGDVLGGVVAALFAQFGRDPQLSPGALAALAVEIHARAGDLWRDMHGDAGALAHEIADLVPDAMRAMRTT